MVFAFYISSDLQGVASERKRNCLSLCIRACFDGLITAPSAKANGGGLLAAPGQTDTFYRGVTTLAPLVVTGLVSSTPVIVSSSSVTSDPLITVTTTAPVVVETPVIGQGKGNPTGNLREKTATTTTTQATSTVTATKVIDTANSRHGAPFSNGKALVSTPISICRFSPTRFCRFPVINRSQRPRRVAFLSSDTSRPSN